MSKDKNIATPLEIGLLSKDLTPVQQQYILSAINAFIFSEQEKNKPTPPDPNDKQTA